MKKRDMNNGKIAIGVNINGRKVKQYTVDFGNGEHKRCADVVAYINNGCGSEDTKKIATELLKTFTGQIVRELIWTKGAIKLILSDAFEMAPTTEMEDSVIQMQIHLLPLLERVYDPATNKMSKEISRMYYNYQTYDQVLTVIFGQKFIEDGIISFTAKLK